MKPTSASTAVAKLNDRSTSQQYAISQPCEGMFLLTERIDGNYLPISKALMLKDFVKEVNVMGFQES